MPDILLVEDKDSLRRVLRLTLENAGYTVTEAADTRAAVNEISRAPHRVVLTDLRMHKGSGLDDMRASRAADADVPVVVMTPFGSIDEAVQAMKDGAHDFLQKPVDSNHLLLLVERALEQAKLRTENILLREEWSRRYGFPRIVGESKAIKAAVNETQRVAQTEATVAATNKDLKTAAENGEFRGDLFFRLAVFPVEIPPLRDRSDDIVLLAKHFAAQLGKELRGREAMLSETAMAALRAHQWPGNVRELENVIERACIPSDTMMLEPKDLGLTVSGSEDPEKLKGFRPVGNTIRCGSSGPAFC